MTPFVPKPLTSGSQVEGRFGKQDFVYMAEDKTVTSALAPDCLVT
jgi:hypothetical protein